MNSDVKKIVISPDSELGLLLKDAAVAREAVLVDTGEAIYTVVIGVTGLPSALHADNIERSQEGISSAAGSWIDVGADAFNAYIAERRRQSSRPPVEL